MADQEIIPPNKINTITNRQVMGIKKIISWGRVIRTNIGRIVWLTVSKITYEILRVKGLNIM